MCAKYLVRGELWMAKFRECSLMTEMLGTAQGSVDRINQTEVGFSRTA
jgi:hypothetical protein